MKKPLTYCLYLTAIAAARADDGGRGFTASLQNCSELIRLGPVSFASARALVPNSYALAPFNGSCSQIWLIPVKSAI